MSQEAVIWATRIAAVGTLALAATLLWLGPTGVDIDGGWQTPILALEFARTPADLDFLTAEVRAALQLGQRVDMVFPFFYGGLLVASAWARRDVPAAVLGALAIPLDLLENLVIDKILAGTVDLTWLPMATWFKWLAIVASLALLARHHRRLSPLLLLPVPLALGGLLTNHPMLCEGMGVAVSVGFVVLMGLATRPAPA